MLDWQSLPVFKTPEEAGTWYDTQIRLYLHNKPCRLPEQQRKIVDTYCQEAQKNVKDLKSRKIAGDQGDYEKEPDVSYLGQNTYVHIDWKYSKSVWVDEHPHQCWRYAELYESKKYTGEIWVVNIFNGKLIKKWNCALLIEQKLRWCYQQLCPKLKRIKKKAKQTREKQSTHFCEKYRNMTWRDLYQKYPDQIGFYLDRRPSKQELAEFYALKKLGLI